MRVAQIDRPPPASARHLRCAGQWPAGQGKQPNRTEPNERRRSSGRGSGEQQQHMTRRGKMDLPLRESSRLAGSRRIGRRLGLGGRWADGGGEMWEASHGAGHGARWGGEMEGKGSKDARARARGLRGVVLALLGGRMRTVTFSRLEELGEKGEGGRMWK